MLINSLLGSVVGFVLSQNSVFVQISTTYTAFQQHRTVSSLLNRLEAKRSNHEKTVKTPVLLTKDRYLYLNHPQNRDRHAFHVFDHPALFRLLPCVDQVRR